MEFSSSTTKPIKICFLGYEKLYELAKEITTELSSDEVTYLLYDCDMDTQDRCIQDALEQGCEVFIAGPGNAAYFRSKHNLPLLEIPIRIVEYAVAIKKALTDGHKKIAIAHYNYTPPIDVETLSKLMSCEIAEIKFENVPDLYHLMQASDCDAFVGAAATFHAAETLGKAGYLVYSRPSSIRNVCLQAVDLARNIAQTRRNRAITSAIMQNSALAIIVTDMDGKIDFFNRVAQNYSGLSSVQVRDHVIDEFFPNLSVASFVKSKNTRTESFRLVGGAMMRCVQERIQSKSESIGVLITLYPEAHNRKKTDAAPTLTGIYAHARQWESLTAQSPAMKRLIAEGKDLSDSSHPVVVFGEEGSGREGIASCIHYASDRADAPCVTLDLATITEQDAPRILFGYDRDDRTVDGIFSSAAGGSIILKNISLAKPSAIACLRQVLNGNTIYRPGLKHPISTDIRFITTARKDEFDQLRPDLAASLKIDVLEMPSLRERVEDIPTLFRKHLQQNSDISRRFLITEDMDRLLQAYSWPGNILELRAVSVRYIDIGKDLDRLTPVARYRVLVQAIGEEQLLKDLTAKYPVLLQRPITDQTAFMQALTVLKDWLHCSNDDAAVKLGISRTTLWRIAKDAANGEE